ncbi:MAG: glycosyltransferase, partial [Thaumarchaeota archaeon]|nr:glycosyltransferase [Candidatus Calditenuaceae archaeon]
MGSLSVVVLTRNSERTIGQVLGALVGNEDVLDHVVIVDGNSRDRTIEIARGFSDRLDVVFLSDEGKGLGYARDIGWRATDSPYVMMLDSDVVVRRWFMEEAVELLQRDGQLGGVSA